MKKAPSDIEEDLELKLTSLLENLTFEELYDVIHNLAKQVWKKGKTIEVISANASLSQILKGLGPKITKKILGEPKKESEMDRAASQWLRDIKGCEKVRSQVKVAGKIADVVGGTKKYRYMKEIYAIELKANKSGIDRAIGQITTYLEGAHFVYLAISPYVYYQLSDRESRSLIKKLEKLNLGLLVINKRGDITEEVIEAQKSDEIEDEDISKVIEKIEL